MLLFAAAVALAATPAVAADRGSLIQQGLDQLKQGRFDDAEESFEDAEDAEDSSCGECQLGLAMVYFHTEDLRQGEKAAREAVELLRGHPSEYLAHGELGKICLERAEQRSSYFDCAEESFKAALEASNGESANALFYLGLTQLKQANDEEGVATLGRFVDENPHDENVELARSLIEKPLRARKALLPDFEMVTLKSGVLSNRDLEGRVVLIDFWATWCGPCRKAVPFLREIAERHKDDPFVLLSISADRSEVSLRDFIRDRNMTWPQIWDRKRWGARNLDVRQYPTYLVVGPEGEILYRVSGGGGGIEKKLRHQVAKAVRQAR